MITQIYYYSLSQTELDDMGIEENDIVEDICVPTPGNFLRKLQVSDSVLLTLTANITVGNEPDNSGTETVLASCNVSTIQALTPITIDEVINRYKSDPTVNNGIIIDWAFEHKFRSTLIEYLDQYPELRKKINTLIYNHIGKHDYVHVMRELIDRYEIDITADNYRMFAMAAMSKNDSLCEYLLEEKDARIPQNVFNAFQNFGTKRFQHMWDLLKEYRNRVILS